MIKGWKTNWRKVKDKKASQRITKQKWKRTKKRKTNWRKTHGRKTHDWQKIYLQLVAAESKVDKTSLININRLKKRTKSLYIVLFFK